MCNLSSGICIFPVLLYLGSVHVSADDESKPRDCQAILDENVAAKSGEYRIYPADTEQSAISVYCDMESHNGGWIVLMRRQGLCTNFDKRWVEYKNGFGNLNAEFWLGLEKIHTLHQLLSDGYWELVVDVEDKVNGTRVAVYQNFSVGPEDEGYTLTARNFMGTAEDKMYINDGMRFSTVDVDNDQNDGFNCAQYGAWWHRNCSLVNLTGPYDHMQWDSPIDFVEMKMKNFVGGLGGWG